MKALTRLGVLLAATLLFACVTRAVVPDLPKIDTIGLQVRTVSAQGVDESAAILEVEVAPEGADLRWVTRKGVRWTGASGRPVRGLDFSPPVGFGGSVRTLRNAGAQTYAAFDPGGRSLRFFDAEGRGIREHPCRGCWDLVTADLEGTGRQRLVVPAADGRAASSFDARGEPGLTYQADGILTHTCATRIEGEQADGLVFFTERGPGSKGLVRVVGGDGRERARWFPEAGRIVGASDARDGATTLVAMHGDALTGLDALKGARLWHTVVPAASMFKWVHTARWQQGWRILVLAGGARVSQHMIVVVDSDGALLYRDTVDSRVYDLDIPAPDAGEFCVGTIGQVMCYRVAKPR